MISKLKVFLSTILFWIFSSTASSAEWDYHFVGWTNAFIPGAGQVLLGNPGAGLFQASYEVGTFWLGYRASGGSIFSLDGFVSPKIRPSIRAGVEIDIQNQLYGDLLQEFAIKSHMVNVYESYREAARRQNNGVLPDGFETQSTLDLFLEPFQTEHWSDEWAIIPLGVVFASAAIDYTIQVSRSIPQVQRMNPTSNNLHAFNYGIWQPIGSGAPEEMFFRGFLQTEFKQWTRSDLAAISMSTILFSLSHSPGPGRISSAIAGAYLGYLTEKKAGKLAPGIFLHFWSSIILGLETILLEAKAQRSTAPGSLVMQINF